jgi:hypothetical protein
MVVRGRACKIGSYLAINVLLLLESMIHVLPREFVLDMQFQSPNGFLLLPAFVIFDKFACLFLEKDRFCGLGKFILSDEAVFRSGLVGLACVAGLLLPESSDAFD